MNKGNEFAKKRSRDYGCAASLAVIRLTTTETD